MGKVIAVEFLFLCPTGLGGKKQATLIKGFSF